MIPNNTNSLVPTAYYDMFYLRLLGFTYRHISEKTGYSESHVKRLFSAEGVVKDLWQGWLGTAKKQAVDEAGTIMFGNLPSVARALVNTAQNGGISSVAAARLVLLYGMGDPKIAHETRELENGPRTIAELIKQSYDDDK